MGSQYRFPAFAVLIAVLLQISPAKAAQSNAIALDGKSLTFEQIIQVAFHKVPVTIAKSGMDQVSQSFIALIAAAVKGIPIYGLNLGVGENKDHPVFSGPLTPKDCEPSRKFNVRNLYATSAAAGPEAPEVLVRAVMVIRLNTMLHGRSGAQPRVAELYAEFLNKEIHPVLPTQGSVGEADITILAHIGLAMIGEGDVIHNGTRKTAKQALADAGITALEPFGKDSLAIMSSNAYAAAVAVLAVHDAAELLAVSVDVFALSLEALNGNISPFLDVVHTAYGYQGRIASGIRKRLEGSFLWACKDKGKGEPGWCDNSRALQDPLSFRTASHVLAVALDANAALAHDLLVQINSSDDNPAAIFGIQPDASAPEQVKAYYVGPVDVTNPCGPEKATQVSGAVIPTANFEPLPWVVSLERSSIALSHVSRAAAARTTRLGSPEFTKLTRFLTNPKNKEMLGYSAIQKTYAALDAEIQGLSGPVSTRFLPLAGDIEDTATNSVLAANRLRRIVDNLYGVLGIELMHAAQAVDLRRQVDPSLKLGVGSERLFTDFRKHVSFLDRDRPLTPDIAAATRYLRGLGAP
jgi:histidine ammonia-lyase